MIEYTIATKGIHGGYSNISKRFEKLNELEEFLKLKKFKNFKKVKITWISEKECKEEYI